MASKLDELTTSNVLRIPIRCDVTLMLQLHDFHCTHLLTIHSKSDNFLVQSLHIKYIKYFTMVEITTGIMYWKLSEASIDLTSELHTYMTVMSHVFWHNWAKTLLNEQANNITTLLFCIECVFFSKKFLYHAWHI